jgi:hypothetical protein
MNPLFEGKTSVYAPMNITVNAKQRMESRKAKFYRAFRKI